MTETQQENFKKWIETGYGLTRSAKLVKLKPKEVSDFIRKHPDFENDCNKSIAIGMDKALDKTLFIDKLNMWEEVCKSKTMMDIDVVNAYTISKNNGEVATLLGLSIGQLENHLAKNVVLRLLVRNNSY